MMGKNHVIAGCGVGAAVGCVLVGATGFTGVVGQVADMVLSWLTPQWVSGIPTQIIWLVIATGLVVLGSLLPDIDTRQSYLGRYIRFPGPHHGVTHTDWGVGLVLVAALILPGAGWLGIVWLAMAIHCEIDGLSKAGRVRLYPLSPHKTITLSSGTSLVVPHGFRRGAYTVGQTSETVALVAIMSVCVAITVGSVVLLPGWA